MNHCTELLNLEIAHRRAAKEGPRGPEGERYFRKDRLLETMSREYLSWLGLFTESKKGIEMLQKSEIFTALRKLGDLYGTSNYLCTILVNAFDYRAEDEPRQILQLWMEQGSKDLVLYIIEHLRVLYRSGLSSFSVWCVNLLLAKVLTADTLTALKALEVLREACDSDDNLLALIKSNPPLEKLQLGGDGFLAQFLRLEVGTKFLWESGWLENAMRRWMQKGNMEYVELIEKTIYMELNVKDLTTKDDNLQLHIPIQCPLDIRNDVRQIVRRRLSCSDDYLSLSS